MLYSVAFVAMLSSHALAVEGLLIVNVTSMRIELYDRHDGSLINANYIDLSTTSLKNPHCAIAVGNEIWVGDHGGKHIHVWSIDGHTYKSSIPTALGGTRGMYSALFDPSVYVVATNGSFQSAVVTYQATSHAENIEFWLDEVPRDITMRNDGTLLIASQTSHDILHYTTTGVYLGIFHNSDGVSGIDTPNQLHSDPDDTVTATGFGAPAGVYRYLPDGTQFAFHSLSGSNTGVFRLGNGTYLVSGGSGVRTLDPITGAAVKVSPGTGQFYGHIHLLATYCYPDCEKDGDLDVFDFLCFVNNYGHGYKYADCESDNDLDIFDYLCYLNQHGQGC